MGLQVWMPLNGNLDNQGLSVVTQTSGTAKYKTSGKIGQGLDLSSRLAFNCSVLAGCKQFSVAFWVKIEDDSSITTNWQDIVDLADQTADNSSIGTFRAETCYTSGNNYYGVHWHDNQLNAICNIPTNLAHYYGTNNRGIWKHCVMTCNTESFIKIYCDGVFIRENTANMNGGHLTGTFRLGNNGSIVGCLNDLRIYNHILSEQKIKKLSQGLVLHLPLSRNGFGQDNLIPNGSNFSLWSKEGTSSVTLEEDGWYHIQSTNTNTSRYGCYYNLTFPEVGTYTLSAMVKTDWHIGFQALSAFNWTGQTVYGTGAERIVSYTVTTTEENNKCRIYIFGQNTINSTYIKWIKVEKGDKATPWIPNSSDTLYTKMGLNDNIEKDISGYQHNAVLNNITYSPDTPFSNMCSVLNGTNSYIKINDNTWMVDKSNEMTLNMWAYSENWESQTVLHLFSCTEGGGFNTEKGDTGCIRFQVHIYSNEQQSSTAYQAHSSAIRLADLTSGWHMFTAIYTTSGRWIYIDGVLHSSISLTSYGLHFNKSARLFLGCEASGASPTSPYFNGRMSDFRIYYTALSEDDVKDLYEKR